MFEMMCFNSLLHQPFHFNQQIIISSIYHPSTLNKYEKKLEF